MLVRFQALHASFLLVSLVASAVAAQTSPPPSSAVPPAASKTPRQQAWNLLRSGVRSPKTDERATAVRVLSLIRGQREAATMAMKALTDVKPKVRVAAAMALGEMRATSSIPQLKEVLADKEVAVVLAAAHSLMLLKDPSAFDIYYEILTGERKSTQGLVAGQMDTLRDPKKMAMLGFEEGIGFVPFASIGYTAIRTIIKDDTSPVRAAAARELANDTDPKTADGLAVAVNDKNELVETAAIEALAKHRDPASIDKIVPAMANPKDSVKYTAAAAVAYLTAIAPPRGQKKK